MAEPVVFQLTGKDCIDHWEIGYDNETDTLSLEVNSEYSIELDDYSIQKMYGLLLNCMMWKRYNKKCQD